MKKYKFQELDASGKKQVRSDYLPFVIKKRLATQASKVIPSYCSDRNLPCEGYDVSFPLNKDGEVVLEVLVAGVIPNALVFETARRNAHMVSNLKELSLDEMKFLTIACLSNEAVESNSLYLELIGADLDVIESKGGDKYIDKISSEIDVLLALIMKEIGNGCKEMSTRLARWIEGEMEDANIEVFMRDKLFDKGGNIL